MGKLPQKKGTKNFIKEAIRLIPQLLQLLYRLVNDSRVSPSDKLLLVAAIGYVLMPFDLIPDYIPFFGEIDDIYFVALALLRLLHHSDEAVLRENWSGPGDIIQLIDRISRVAVFFLPRRVQEILVGTARTQ